MLLAQFNYSWMFFECAFGLSLTNFSILWNRVLHPTMCVDSPLHQTNPRRAVSALTQEHTANTFPLQNWAACTPWSKNIQLRSSVMLCLFFFFFFEENLPQFFSSSFFEQQLFYTSSALMLIIVYASLGLFVFWPFTLVTLCRRVSALLVKYHYWACLSGTKMCVRQRRAVICQSGVGGYGFQAWPPWCVTAGACGRCWEGGWVGRVRCQCESALFPALDAWSVSLVTADLPVFTLSLHSSSSSGLQCTDLCDHAWLCGTCGFFFFFFRKNQAFDTRHSYGFSLALHRPRWGPSSQSDRGALPCFMPRAVAFNLALPHITESRCAVRPRLV